MQGYRLKIVQPFLLAGCEYQDLPSLTWESYTMKANARMAAMTAMLISASPTHLIRRARSDSRPQAGHTAKYTLLW